MQLWHYSINTGHGRWSPKSEVADNIISAMKSMVEPGMHNMPIPGYQLEVEDTAAGLLCTMFAGDRPIMSMIVAADHAELDHLWPTMEAMYHKVTEIPVLRSMDYIAAKKPEVFPTCIAWPILATPDEAMWLGDFERCLAWAYLETK
jgi:hypothetical protein